MPFEMLTTRLLRQQQEDNKGEKCRSFFPPFFFTPLLPSFCVRYRGRRCRGWNDASRGRFDLIYTFAARMYVEKKEDPLMAME